MSGTGLVATLSTALGTGLPVAVPVHGVGSRQDLPLPFTALVIGAALALLASFVGLGLLWREPRLHDDDGWALPRTVQSVLDSRWTRGVAAGLSGVLTVWVLVSLLAGRDTADNPVGYVVYVWLWVGLPVLSLVFGPVWTTLNPLRRLHRGLASVARIDRDARLTDAHPGRWPAAVLLLVFTWLELVAPDRTTLPVLRIAVAFFVLVSIAGSLIFGRSWFREGDPFEVLSRVYGQLSPLARRGDRRFALRTPVHSPSLLPARRGLLATVSVLLGGTAYDSLSSDIRYAAWVQSTSAPELLRTATLVATCLVVGLALLLAARIAARIAGVPGHGMGEYFAPSVIPIAAGYLVAHYWSLGIFQGQRTLALLSDPLGTGADLLGTAAIVPGQALIAPTLVAAVQAGAIVLGHVLGVVVAHERAVRLFDRRSAVLGQLPLMVVMVLYTVGGLSLLFAA
ncbi:hypothetical protein [Lapillicoccus sp.]|uniref:hypothetical protein n=1 Tax=Lapillicoccus sp. TaxID=1909287 RepID=UPI0025D150F7|nr:hypothetical protein [Lapillicoccus sp.]